MRRLARWAVALSLVVTVLCFYRLSRQMCMDFSTRPGQRSDYSLLTGQALWQYNLVGTLFVGLLTLVV